MQRDDATVLGHIFFILCVEQPILALYWWVWHYWVTRTNLISSSTFQVLRKYFATMILCTMNGGLFSVGKWSDREGITTPPPHHHHHWASNGGCHELRMGVACCSTKRRHNSTKMSRNKTNPDNPAAKRSETYSLFVCLFVYARRNDNVKKFRLKKNRQLAGFEGKQHQPGSSPWLELKIRLVMIWGRSSSESEQSVRSGPRWEGGGGGSGVWRHHAPPLVNCLRSCHLNVFNLK